MLSLLCFLTISFSCIRFGLLLPVSILRGQHLILLSRLNNLFLQGFSCLPSQLRQQTGRDEKLVGSLLDGDVGRITMEGRCTEFGELLPDIVGLWTFGSLMIKGRRRFCLQVFSLSALSYDAYSHTEAVLCQAISHGDRDAPVSSLAIQELLKGHVLVAIECHALSQMRRHLEGEEASALYPIDPEAF